MASSVFFRFKSQKEPTRVVFDGTGISVFELKREIITLSKLGDGTDFELILSSDDGGEVYDDDTTIIPRSTTVIAKRLPAAKPGRGGAARYVSGKMPVNAKNSYRTETAAQKGNLRGTKASTNGVANVAELQTEEERMAAVLKMGADQWAQQQQEMAHATPIHRGGPMKGKPINVPDRPPPPGYVCYRCGEKGHWIQVCPTNDDPTFDGRPRIKRTTGIPRSFLKIVEKPTAIANDGTVDDTKQPSGVMVNADGDWVIAEPDKASWEQYQAKAQVSAAAQKEEARGSKELQDRGLECSIDKHLFVDPTKTPCCHTTYCNECITNALLDNDLQCPGCGKDGVLIDDLVPDVEMQSKIRSYEVEKAREAAAKESPKEKARSPEIKQEDTASVQNGRPESKSPDSIRSSPSTTKSTTSNPKKRPADSELENVRIPTGPKALVNAAKSQDSSQQTATTQGSVFPPELAFMNQPPFTNGINMLGMNGVNPFMAMPMTMSSMMGMTPGMMNPMMMPNNNFMSGMNTQWNGMNNMNGIFPQQQNGSFGMMPSGGFTPNPNQGQMNGQMGGQMGNGYQSMNGMNGTGRGMGGFANQQRTNFGGGQRQNQAEDSAYFRQPVNPHRHQGRRNVTRPADYREI